MSCFRPDSEGSIPSTRSIWNQLTDWKVRKFLFYTLDLCQVFRHIFLRILTNFSSFAWRVVINFKNILTPINILILPLEYYLIFFNMCIDRIFYPLIFDYSYIHWYIFNIHLAFFFYSPIFFGVSYFLFCLHNRTLEIWYFLPT